MIAKRLVSTMNASSSDMGQIGPGFKKFKMKLKGMKVQRGMKKAMKKQEEGKLSKAPKDDSSDSEINKYAHPGMYKMNQMKENMQEKFQDRLAEMKQRRSERKNKRAGAGGEGGFKVCGPGGCKMGEAQPGLGSNWKGQ